MKSVDEAMQIQFAYAKHAYEKHIAEMSKLGQMWVGMVTDASKPVEKLQEGSNSGSAGPFHFAPRIGTHNFPQLF